MPGKPGSDGDFSQFVGSTAGRAHGGSSGGFGPDHTASRACRNLDSRQAAAFFAPYLESSHALVLQRRLILDGLARATACDPSCSVDDLIEAVAAAAGAAGVFGRRESRQARRRETARWVLRELIALDERQSLEGLGLIRAVLDVDQAWRPPAPLLALGFTADECWLLLGELARTLRLQGALSMPEEVDPADEMFDPRRGPVYVRVDGAEAKLKVLSWLPTRGVNKRLDYLSRVLTVIGEGHPGTGHPGAGHPGTGHPGAGHPGTGDADAREVLAGCWRALTGVRDGWLTGSASLADVLVPEDDTSVPGDLITAILRSVALDGRPFSSAAVIGADGCYSQGITVGRHRKEHAEYIGATARARRRAARIAECDEKIGELAKRITEAGQRAAELADTLQAFADARRALPSTREIAEAQRQHNRAAGHLRSARHAAGQAQASFDESAAAVTVTERALRRTAAEHALTPEATDQVEAATRRFESAARDLEQGRGV